MEAGIWIVVPLIFAGLASWLFKLLTKTKKVWPFVVLAVVSVFGYLYIEPTCGCIGIDQILGALLLAVPLNLILFLCGFIVIFGFVRVRRSVGLS